MIRRGRNDRGRATPGKRPRDGGLSQQHSSERRQKTGLRSSSDAWESNVNQGVARSMEARKSIDNKGVRCGIVIVSPVKTSVSEGVLLEI